MNAQDVLSGLVLFSMAANICDRLITGRPGFFHFPRTGLLRRVFTAWSILLAAVAYICLIRAIPGTYFVALGAAYMVCLQGYAIHFRHRATGSPL
jgi:hypothetical protein